MPFKKIIAYFRGLIQACYDYMLKLAGNDNAVYYLAVVSFIESSFFPIPPDIMLSPMVLPQ